uniref:Secreted protein n=1 Tax=Panagrellus redivivus TaxID=6233 RepID=A0A7E4VJ36_PANRE
MGLDSIPTCGTSMTPLPLHLVSFMASRLTGASLPACVLIASAADLLIMVNSMQSRINLHPGLSASPHLWILRRRTTPSTSLMSFNS